MKKTLIALLTSLLLVGTTSSAFAMWGPVDDDDEQAKQAVIQRQFEELEPLGARLTNNMLYLSLKEDNQVQLALALTTSPELLTYYDAHLYYQAPLSRDHLPLLRCLKKFASLMFYNQTLDITKGTILSTLFSQHSTLTKLDFPNSHNFKLTDDGLISIQQSMSLLPHLKVLNLQNQNALGHNGFSALSNILSNTISLEELNLGDMNFGPQGESQVLSQLSKLTNLRKLNLVRNQLVGEFFTSLKSLPNLMEINVWDNQITGKKLRSLPKSKFKDCLKILTISNNQIDDEGLNLISTLPNLLTLYIANNNITDEGVNETTDLQNLTFLDIINNKLSAASIIYLARNTQIKEIKFLADSYDAVQYLKVLRNDPSIKRLQLRQSRTVNIGTAEAQALACNSTCIDLSLEGANIGDTVAQAFANNTTLTYLTLIDSTVGDVGAQALAQHSTLTNLCLSKHNIGDAGARALALNTTLRILTLIGGNIGNAGVEYLAQNTTLTELHLSSTQIGDAGAQALAQNTTLQRLYLSYNKIEYNGAQALRKSPNINLRNQWNMR